MSNNTTTSTTSNAISSLFKNVPWEALAGVAVGVGAVAYLWSHNGTDEDTEIDAHGTGDDGVDNNLPISSVTSFLSSGSSLSAEAASASSVGEGASTTQPTIEHQNNPSVIVDYYNEESIKSEVEESLKNYLKLSNISQSSSSKMRIQLLEQNAIAAPSSNPSVATASNSGNGIPFPGVSLRWFINFMKTDEKVKKILNEKGNKASMDDLLSVVKDMTSEVDESFAEMLKRTQPDKRLTKPTADVFISYARLYFVNDMIPAIETLLPNEGDIYIWMDSLAINQRVKSEFDPEFFVKTLKQGIETISNVAVVLTPWDNPGNLTRAWCIWELYSAVESKGVNIQVLIPPTQRKPFRDALIKEPLQLITKIGKIDLENAQAWSAKDRDMILDAARKSEGGIPGVRESVIQPLRNWMTNEALEMVNEIDKSIEEGNNEYNQDELGQALSCTGFLLVKQDKYNEAEPLFRRTLSIDTQRLGIYHANFAANANNLADLHKKQGDYGNAEELLKCALHADATLLKKTSCSFAYSINSLAMLCREKGEYERAESLLRIALSIREKELGNDHSDVADSLDSLANLLSVQSKCSEAEPLYQRSLAIRKKVHGRDHPYVATGMNNLALFLKSQGQYDEAETLLREAIKINKSNYGNDHTSVASNMCNLADVLHFKGQNDEAELQYRGAIRIYESLFGSKHQAVAKSLNSLASFLKKKENYAEAEELFERSIDIFESTFGLEDPKVAAVLNNLAELLELQGRYDEARSSYERAARIIHSKLGAEHPDYLMVKNNFDLFLEEEEKRKVASMLR